MDSCFFFCFELEAPLHQRNVCFRIKTYAPNLVLKIGKLPTVLLCVQIRRLECQSANMFHEFSIPYKVNKWAPIGVDSSRVMLKQ